MDFFDWLECYQDFDFELPIITDRALQHIDIVNGDYGLILQPTFQHKGSFCSSISIKISGNRIKMSGNPSKFNRIDNLFGFTSIDQCFSVFNQILLSLGLPVFTKCTQIFYRQGVDGKRVETFSNGAVITRLDVTTNVSVGNTVGSEIFDFIKGVSTQRYRNSIPHLHTNGCSVDWLSVGGKASLIYPIIYNKANELRLHSLTKIKNKFGVGSAEYNYLIKLIEFCESNGVARFEQKFKHAYLRKHNLRFWGLFNGSHFFEVQQQFLSIDEKLKVTAMDFETLTEQLISNDVVTNTRSANMTAMYAIEWAHGKTFDFTKTQVKLHRCRLRKIGIDIKDTFNVSRFSPVVIKKAKEITVSSLAVPTWYELPKVNNLRLVA